KQFLTGLRIPHLGFRSILPGSAPATTRTSAAATSQKLAVGAKGHAQDINSVPLHGECRLAGRWIPDLHLVGIRTSGQAPAVRTKRYAPLTGRLESEFFLVFLRIPDLDREVLKAGTGQVFAVRAEGHASGPARVLDGEDLLAGLCIPQLHIPSGAA